MKLKTPLSRKQNRKNSQGRLSLRIPLSSRKSIETGRLPMANKRQSFSRPSFTTIQSRASLPVKTRNSYALEVPLKKDVIIQNLVKKLGDQEELRSIIESKYYGNESYYTVGKSQINGSFCHNCCSNVTQNPKPYSIRFQREKDESRFLRQKLRNCQQQMIFMKQNGDLCQSTQMFQQELMNVSNTQKRPRKSFRNEVGVQAFNNVQRCIDTRENLNEEKSQKDEERKIKSIKQSFMNNLDSTLNILGGVSVARVR